MIMKIADDVRNFAPSSAIEVLGDNALMQMSVVVPNFFEGPYVITRMEDIPIQAGQRQILYRCQCPKVVDSTISDFPAGSVLESRPGERFVDAVRKGINITISPSTFRNGVYHGQRMMESYAIDPLTVASIGPHGSIEDLGEPIPLYVNEMGRGVFLERSVLSPDAVRYNACRAMNYAFLSSDKVKNRTLVGIDVGWKRI